MNEDKKRILEKLKRLMSMTTEAGASEQEAMLAAEKAAALMAEHNISYRSVADIEAEDFSDDKRPWCKGWKGRKSHRLPPLPPVNMLLFDISALCGVENWYSRATGDLAYFGAPQDTAVAHYLTEIINRAMLREWKAFSAKRLKASRASFMQGMALRLSKRLSDMAEQTRVAQATATGTDMVLVKDALVKSRFKAANPDLQEASKPRKPDDPMAVWSGYKAGDNVALSKGLNEASGVTLIGGGA
ncbi:MAG: DUF2786 domain-containing protein [Hyphomicrobiaceae bacterium]